MTLPTRPTSMFLAPFLALALASSASAAAPAAITRVLEPGKKLDDPRLGPPRTLNDKYHPWIPAATRSEWEKQSRSIRERVLVSAGLWPMPPKEPLRPVIHGKIDRGAYTVEKVFFASLPGHYVSGNLYRPAKVQGKVPGVLCPHGHWKDGRFYDAGAREARRQLDEGAEASMAGARYPLQARMAELARLGCVVFHYDMVGVADSKPLSHANGFTDPECELRLQSFLGLQTFNSIRALDFLLSLPDVDPARIGVTGASGGGTQTFLLCAVDPRPTVAFPAVMVSTAMQGGCICETADLLRVGISNVAIAALFAPKPLKMSGANDWTIDIERKGLPELKQIYSLYGQSNNVDAKCFPQFGHNYNRVSRQVMDNWFNEHLGLKQASPVAEEDFWPIDPKELSVFDDKHPRPRDAKTAAELRQQWTALADQQFAELLPANAGGLGRYREVVGTAAHIMLDPGLPDLETIQAEVTGQDDIEGGLHLLKGIASRQDDKTRIPWIILRPDAFNGTAVLWIDGQGKSHLFNADGKPTSAAAKLMADGNAVVSIDLLRTGESIDGPKKEARKKGDRRYAGYTYAYNPTLLASRVHDVITAVGGLRKNESVQKIRLVGTGDAGPCVLFAAALLGNQVADAIVDARGLSYRKIPPADDSQFLPGALKYGGLGGLAALAAPLPLQIFGTSGIPAAELAPLSRVYQAAGGKLTVKDEPLTPEMVVQRLSRR